jgi:hypothetical protein
MTFMSRLLKNTLERRIDGILAKEGIVMDKAGPLPGGVFI